MSLADFVDIEFRLDVPHAERRAALAKLRPLDRLAWMLRGLGGGDA